MDKPTTTRPQTRRWLDVPAWLILGAMLLGTLAVWLRSPRWFHPGDAASPWIVLAFGLAVSLLVFLLVRERDRTWRSGMSLVPVVLRIALITVSVETLIMLLMPRLGFPMDSLRGAIMDASMLAVVAGGMIYRWVIRPLDRELGRQLEETRLIAEEIKERDAEARKLALLASRTSNAVVVTDSEGRVEWVNEGFTRITGYTLDEVAGRTPGSVLQGPKTDPGTVARMRACLARGEGFKTEVVNYGKDGREYWLEIEVQPVRDENGSICNFMAIESDVTERRMADEALKSAVAEAKAANLAKSEFLARMSHEIRTPMNGVIGMSGLLLETQLTPEQREFAEIVARSGTQLLEIINDILDFSKIEAGKLKLERVDVDVRALVDDVVSLMEPRARERGLELAAVVNRRVPPVITGDPTRLRQVLLNLLSNALKFTQKGSVTLRLDGEPAPGGCAALVFEVADTGIGIPAEHQAHIFEPFTQADSTTTRQFGGTGLGLAICNELVQMMGGKIFLASQQGRGSTFRFRLAFEVSGAAKPPARLGMLVVAGRGGLACESVAETLAAAGWSVGAATPEKLPDLVAGGSGNMPDALVLVRPEAADLDRLADAETRPHVAALVPSGPRPVPRVPGLVDTWLTFPCRHDVLTGALMGAARRGDAARAPAPVAGTPAAKAPGGASPILVVEDNAVNQLVIRHVLEKLGHHPDLAGGGQEACDAVAARPYAVVLMDCMMPGKDGFDTTRTIRAMPPPARDCVIVALTAAALKGDRERCLAAGMDDYLAKPIQPAQIAAVLATYLAEHDTLEIGNPAGFLEALPALWRFSSAIHEALAAGNLDDAAGAAAKLADAAGETGAATLAREARETAAQAGAGEAARATEHASRMQAEFARARRNAARAREEQAGTAAT